ncbi:MAG: selenocysteine-specific translation elongation factor [Pyrinomonadaceae bacterium]
MDIIIGTAGHIDHGKTALVRALTGVDADRLPEEKRRGITIDLGFAELNLEGIRFGFVDVPGHEKFVKNMLAGAHGIDVVALVIAADEGVMPQTREHFDICRLLEVKTGIVVLTKTDLVDEELLELVRFEAAELVQNSFLENAPVISVSAKTGAGIEELKEILKNTAQTIPVRENETVTLLPIDRAFSIKGFGAVVTGTLVSGEIAEGAEMELLPGKDSSVTKKVRVRGVQTYGKTVVAAHAGQRTAVNLGGIDYTEIERGMVLAELNNLRQTQIFDAQIEVLNNAPRSLKSRQRVRVHVGTVEVLARVQVLNERNEIAVGEKGLAQLRLETPIVAVPNERFIVRSYSPQRTIAGGRILDGLAVKHRRRDFATTRTRLEKWLAANAQNDKHTELRLFLETADEHGLTTSDLQARTGWRKEILENILSEVIAKKSIIKAEEFFLTRTAFENLLEKTFLEIESHHRHEPLSRGIGRETLREKVFAHLPIEIFRGALGELEKRDLITSEKDIVCAASYNRILSPIDQELLNKLQQIYALAKLEVPVLENALAEAVIGTKVTVEYARKIFQLLLDTGELVRVTPEFYFRREYLTNLVGKMREFAAAAPDKVIEVAQFKDLAGVSRKYAIPLLEYFDREKVTRRAGDKRLLL